MNDEERVKEMVKWVEQEIRDWIIANYPVGNQVFLDLAKQILSHPDLALIDRENELPKLPEHLSDKDFEWMLDFVKRARKAFKDAGYLPVIPLAKAIKEIEDGH